jgi:hypothetical protein
VVVDDPNGRLYLPAPVPQSSVVQAEFSYRLFQLYTADAFAWLTLQPDSFRNDDSHFLQVGSGAWDVLAQDRIQLPAVFIEAVPRVDRQGLMLGGGVWARQDVLFHIVAEERWHSKWLHDAVTYQWDKRLYGFDKNAMLTADAFPLDASGSPRPGALMYPDLVQPTGAGGFQATQIRFQNTQSTHQPRLGSLWYVTVRATMEVDQFG